MDLQRLKHDIPIRKNGDQTALLQIGDYVERLREQPLCERIIEQKQRQLEKVLFARALAPVTLESTEIVGVAQILLQLLEDLPIMLLLVLRELEGEVSP